jgi:hypothetical protein
MNVIVFRERMNLSFPLKPTECSGKTTLLDRMTANPSLPIDPSVGAKISFGGKKSRSRCEGGRAKKHREQPAGSRNLGYR